MIKSTQVLDYILSQITELLDILNNDQYSTPIPSLGGSSIGQHVRHIYDFYNCINLSQHLGQLDYSCRDRNPDIETNTDFALNLFIELSKQLHLLDKSKSVSILSEFTADIHEDREWFNSSIGRELLYAYDHAIHHLAIIKVGIKASFPDIQLPDNMGVAPSTIKHKKEIIHR